MYEFDASRYHEAVVIIRQTAGLARDIPAADVMSAGNRVASIEMLDRQCCVSFIDNQLAPRHGLPLETLDCGGDALKISKLRVFPERSAFSVTVKET